MTSGSIGLGLEASQELGSWPLHVVSHDPVLRAVMSTALRLEAGLVEPAAW